VEKGDRNIAFFYSIVPLFHCSIVRGNYGISIVRTR